MLKFLKLPARVAFALLLLQPGLAGAAEANTSGSRASDAPGYSIEMLRRISDGLTRTGRGRNAIVPLYRPAFVRALDAGLSMDDREPVFVVTYPNGLVRVYPQYIMVWHEVINDVLPGAASGVGNTAGTGYGQAAENSANSYTIAYSPLTGTVTAFKSLAGRFPSIFGNEGVLYNGNLVMFDNTTGSLWSQLLAVAVDGQLRGKRLERIPVYWCRWGGVKKRFPQAQVLSRATGYKRDYGRDPYGSYLRNGTYYDDARMVYAAQPISNQLPSKERILGLEIEGLYGALLVDAVRQAKVLNQGLGLHRVVGLYDADLDRVRVFDRRLPGGDLLDFEVFEGRYVDKGTRSQWNSDGECFYGKYRDSKLKAILAVDSMWFAWYAFHPDTAVLGPERQLEIRGPKIPY